MAAFKDSQSGSIGMISVCWALSKISCRTVDTIDANAICANFGGGGHNLAAGCRLFGHLDEIVNLVLDQAIEMFDVTGVVK